MYTALIPTSLFSPLNLDPIPPPSPHFARLPATMVGLNIVDLPDEVIQAILYHVPANSAIALERTCQRFRDISNEPLLWKHYCETEFRWWDKSHRIRTKLRTPSFLDWKILYAQHRATDHATKGMIDDLVSHPTGRLDIVKSIVQGGYDSKDMLMLATRQAPSSACPLAQR